MDKYKDLSTKVVYLKGLADGMDLDKSANETKLLLRIIDVLDDFANEIERLDTDQRDMREAVEELEDMGEWIYDEKDESEESSGGASPSYRIKNLEEGSFIEYECPHCSGKIYYDANTFDIKENHLCPECGKELFPEDENGKA